jgi:hypothetical protein
LGVIPSEIAEIFVKLEEQVLWLLLHWQVYSQLFNHSKQRRRMLKECANIAFFSFEIGLESEILMSLSRLTDEPLSGDKERLSFEKLHSQIRAAREDELSRKLRVLIKDIRNKCDKIRDHRDNLLAHLNFNINMRKVPTPDLATASDIEAAIKSVAQYMNTIQEHYGQKSTNYDFVAGISTQDGDALITWLKMGLRLDELIREKKICVTERREGKWKDV